MARYDDLKTFDLSGAERGGSPRPAAAASTSLDEAAMIEADVRRLAALPPTKNYERITHYTFSPEVSGLTFPAGFFQQKLKQIRVQAREVLSRATPARMLHPIVRVVTSLRHH